MKSKYALIIFAGLLLCLLSACIKGGSDSNNTSISGKWNIVSDSTFNGVGLGNHPVNYAGQPGDYFDFRTDGKVYTKEGTVLDTLSFNQTTYSEIVISSFGLTANGVPETSEITTLSAHSLVIVAPKVFTPGGIFGRKVSLSR